jgi:hypothetical protein
MTKVQWAVLGTAMSLWSSPCWAVEITLCIGEYERACQAHQSYAYCYTDPNDWATNFCKAVNDTGDHRLATLNSYGGNKCGYTMVLVICR